MRVIIRAKKRKLIVVFLLSEYVIMCVFLTFVVTRYDIVNSEYYLQI